MPNKGTGAGGKNTNKNGYGFEEQCSLDNYLIEYQNFEWRKIGETRKAPSILQINNILYTKQENFKRTLYNLYNKVFSIHRVPDGAFICIDENKVVEKIIIIEIKNQNKDGSVDDKLYIGDVRIEEYQEMFRMNSLEAPEIYYCFVLNEMLSSKFIYGTNQKFKIARKILYRRGIPLFDASISNFKNNLINWVLNIAQNNFTR